MFFLSPSFRAELSTDTLYSELRQHFQVCPCPKSLAAVRTYSPSQQYKLHARPPPRAFSGGSRPENPCGLTPLETEEKRFSREAPTQGLRGLGIAGLLGCCRVGTCAPWFCWFSPPLCAPAIVAISSCVSLYARLSIRGGQQVIVGRKK